MSNLLYNWLIGEMGTPGEYQYRSIHLYSTLAVGLAAAVFFYLAFRLRKDPRRSRYLLVSVSVFHLAFEVFWRIIYLFVKKASLLSWWPVYPCNLGGLLLPVIALTNWKRGKQMFYLFGFVGSILTFALPEGIFCRDVLVFPILKSILQHTGLLLIPVLELIGGTYRPTLGDMGWVTAGCTVHLVNCEVIDRLLGFTGDYMFFRSGLPFVIPGVPQNVTLSVFALAVLSLLSLLCDPKGSRSFLHGIRHKQQALSP